MKAIILIGGQGTRLRPYTCDTPKPLLPVVNRPFLLYQLAVLRRQGIREAILCTAYRAADFRRALAAENRMNISFVHEPSPLGTGGAVRNAAGFIDQTALVLNGDVLHDLDVRAFVRSHRRARAGASIALTRVKDPTTYGLVETREDGRVRRFLEKPSWDEVTCNTVNAGAYLFEPEVLRLIPQGVEYSLERGLFPSLLQTGGRIAGYVAPGYWLDFGTVDKYLQIHLDILGGRTPFGPARGTRRGSVHLGTNVRLGREVRHEGPGTAVLGRGTRIGDFVRLTGSVSVGKVCSIGQGAQLEDCVVLDGTVIGHGAQLKRCIVGPGCRVGNNATIGPGRALGEGSVLSPFSQL